jgi:hypothetical protein
VISKREQEEKEQRNWIKPINMGKVLKPKNVRKPCTGYLVHPIKKGTVRSD